MYCGMINASQKAYYQKWSIPMLGPGIICQVLSMCHVNNWSWFSELQVPNIFVGSVQFLQFPSMNDIYFALAFYLKHKFRAILMLTYFVCTIEYSLLAPTPPPTVNVIYEFQSLTGVWMFFFFKWTTGWIACRRCIFQREISLDIWHADHITFYVPDIGIDEWSVTCYAF